MFRAICSLVAIASVVSSQSTKTSPCPNVFTYEPPVIGEKLDPGTAKWYGSINLSTDITLHALWINIILDNKANILGNWVGEVTTEDNLNFKIENTKLKITPGTPLTVRFFVQYNSQDIEPKLQSILFNGREICTIEETRAIVEYPISTLDNYDASNEVPIRTDTTTTSRSITTLTTGNVYDRLQTKTQYRTTTTVKPNYWTQTKAAATEATTERIQSKYETTKNDNKTQVTSNLWNWGKVENTQQIKPVENSLTKNKDQNLATTGNTQTKTQPWSQNKTASVTKSENKVQSVQSTSQVWSAKPTNNQQIKSEKQQVTTESSSRLISYTKPWLDTKKDTQQLIDQNKQQAVSEDKTKVQLWSQVKVVNDQTKSENKQASQSRFNFQSTTDTTHNKGEVWSPTVGENNQQQTNSKNTQSKNEDTSQYSQYNVNNNNNHQTVVRPEVYEVTSYVQSQTTPQRKLDSDSFVESDNRQITQTQQQRGSSYQSFGSSQQGRPEESSDRRNVNTATDRLDDVFELRPITRKDSESHTSRPAEDNKWSQDQPKIIFESAGSSNSNNNVRKEIVQVLQSSSNGYQQTTSRPSLSRPEVFPLETYDSDYDNKDDDGPLPGLIQLPMLYIPNLRPQDSCGKVTKKPQRDLSYGSSTSEGQWPWQTALYQQQTVNFKYICGGTLISKRHVITAAHCVARKKSKRVVNKNTLTVYLGKFNLRTSVDGVQVKFVNRIIIHPGYNASIFSRDLAILELREPITYSDWVRPACLWPENEIGRSYIVGKKGSVVGWGFDVSGSPREELNLLEMPVVDQETCISSYIEFYEKFTSEFTYCAGYKDGTSVCNGDSGGGMVFLKGSNWYLRGVASLSIARPNEKRCDPSHYVIFTDIAKFLPWIEENMQID